MELNIRTHEWTKPVEHGSLLIYRKDAWFVPTAPDEARLLLAVDEDLRLLKRLASTRYLQPAYNNRPARLRLFNAKAKWSVADDRTRCKAVVGGCLMIKPMTDKWLLCFSHIKENQDLSIFDTRRCIDDKSMTACKRDLTHWYKREILPTINQGSL